MFKQQVLLLTTTCHKHHCLKRFKIQHARPIDLLNNFILLTGTVICEIHGLFCCAWVASCTQWNLKPMNLNFHKLFVSPVFVSIHQTSLVSARLSLVVNQPNMYVHTCQLIAVETDWPGGVCLVRPALPSQLYAHLLFSFQCYSFI